MIDSEGISALFDTHAHLHLDEFEPDRPEVLARARAAGVEGFLTVGIDPEDSQRAVALAEAEPAVWATVGIHPHEAATADEAALDRLRRLAQGSSRVVAVGETGLDYYRDLAPRDAQLDAFRRQIALARELGRPLVIHCREAHAEVLAVLREERAAEVGGIMHCFSGDAAHAWSYLDLGFLISIAGPVTYPNARKLPEVVRAVPLDRLVVETDCPFLPPQPYRGKRNEPAWMVHTAERVATLAGVPIEELAPRLSANARRLLRLPAP